MNALQPHLEMLRAYVHGTLDAEVSEAVRGWLYTGATEDELMLYEALVQEREEARAQLVRAASSPMHSKIAYALHRLGSTLAGGGDALTRAVQLDGFRLLSRDPDDELATGVGSDQTIDVQLVLGADGAFVVLCVEAGGAVTQLAEGVAVAGERIHLPGLQLEQGDDEVVIVALIAPGAAPRPSDDKPTGAWLLERVLAPPSGWRVVHHTYRRIRFAP